jgi:hypothetical protein
MPDTPDVLNPSASDELAARLFSAPAMMTRQDPLPPLQRPGVEGREAIFNAGTRGMDSGPTTGLLTNPADVARANTFARILAQLISNTNFTAAPPAHVEPPLWSDPVDLTARVQVPAAVTDWVPVINYFAPNGRWARLASYGVDVEDPAYTYDGSLLWRIRVNDNDVPSLANWGEHRGSMAQPRSTFIVLRENWKVSFQVRRAVAAVAPVYVDFSLQGWAWRYRHNFEGTKTSITSF